MSQSPIMKDLIGPDFADDPVTLEQESEKCKLCLQGYTGWKGGEVAISNHGRGQDVDEEEESLAGTAD